MSSRPAPCETRSCSMCARTVIPPTRESSARAGRDVGSRASSAVDHGQPQPEKGEEIDTIFDTQELTSFIEEAEADGVIDASALVTQALEFDLDDEDLALLRAALESRGIEITDEDE